MYTQLSLEQAPPLHVPLRFFLTLPLFGVLCAIILLLYPGSLASRWSPITLGLTHLFTLGVLTMAMFGALFQMLPVVAGAVVINANRVATLVHLLLVIGTLCFAVGMAFIIPEYEIAALVCLVTAFLIFIVAVGNSLFRVPRLTHTIIGMRLAVTGLFITLILGSILLAGHSIQGLVLYRHSLTAPHVLWGSLGWVGLLIIAVAYQVVPMFQMTKAYHVAITRWLTSSLFILLLLWILLELVPMGLQPISNILVFIISAGYVLFAIYTLQLQRQRRRRIADITLRFWQFGLSALLVAIALWLSGHHKPASLSSSIYLQWSAGIVFLTGFALSIINGMLYKIVPFLIWFHTQHQATNAEAARQYVPKMRSIMDNKLMQWQFRLHVSACVFLVFITSPLLVRIAAVLLLVSFLLLGYNLLNATRIYQHSIHQLHKPA